MEKSFGRQLAEARKRKDLSQEELSSRHFMARSSVAGWETERRNIPDDAVRELTMELDDVDLYFSAWRHVSGDVSIPLMDGKNVNQMSPSMVFLVEQETKEALESVRNTPWHLPLEMRNKEDIEKTIHELLDAIASMLNLVACLCREQKLPMVRIFRKWQVSMKNRGFQQ